MTDRNDEAVYYEIKEHIAVLGIDANGWKKELNLISWNGGETKYDIRVWDPEHKYMTGGINLRERSFEKLYEALNDFYSEMGEDVTLASFSDRDPRYTVSPGDDDKSSWHILLPIGRIDHRDYSGFFTELNIVSLKNDMIMYDIRSWSIDHSAMTKGMQFNDEEMKALHKALKSIYLGRDQTRGVSDEKTGMTKERAVEIACCFIEGDLDNSEYDYVSDKLRGLDITEEEIKELGLEPYLSSLDVIFTIITFDNNGREDQTQFDTEDPKEILSLWEDFAKENSLDPSCIISAELRGRDVFVVKDEDSYGLFAHNLYEAVCDEKTKQKTKGR